jgi:hypothetical protein
MKKSPKLPWLLKREVYLHLLHKMLLSELRFSAVCNRSCCWVSVRIKYWPATNTNNTSVDGINTNNAPQVVREGEQGKTQHSTTTFVTDANVASTTVNLRTTIPKLLVDSSTTGFYQDIIAFLSKPIELESGTLKNTDTVSSFNKRALPSFALNQNIYGNKLSGFLGFKADMRFKFILNGTRFQSGRYKLTWTPIGGAPSGGSQALSWWNAHNATLVQRSQLMGVEMDVSCDTEGDLVIPFSSFLNYFPLATKVANVGTYFGDVGYIHLMPYAALDSIVTPIVAPYRIMFNFENIELISPAAPQMARVSKGNKSKSLSESEKDSQGVGPISGPLLSVSKASNELVSIPLLSDYARGLSWATDIIGNAALAFGWSKPINNMATTRNLPQILPYMGNVDTVDQSLPLSVFVKNEVEDVEGFSGTDVDETSFKFLATIPAYNQTLSWTTATPAGTQLSFFPMDPSTYGLSRVVNGMTLVDLAPCAYIARKFRYYRSSMIFTFKIVKTEFHSGRLLVGFYPETNVNAFTSARSMDNSNYVHREIVDVRMCNEFTLRVPYTASTPFSVSGLPFGFLHVFVFDQLVCPDNVPNTVKILVEVSCGEDCEFSVPVIKPSAPVLNLSPQMSNLQDDSVCNLISTDIGSSRVLSDNLMSSKACIGESILSFRSLLKMSHQICPHVLTTSPVIGDVWLTIHPFLVTYFWNQVTPIYPTFLGTLFDELSSMYTFSRGGMRFKLVNHSPVVGFRPIIATSMFDNLPGVSNPIVYSNVNPVGDSPMVGSGKPVAYSSNTNASIELQTPQYTGTHSRNNILNMCAGSAMVPNIEFPNSTTRLLITIPGQTSYSEWAIYRSVSDDFNLGQFVSIPPLRYGIGGDYLPYIRS